MRKIAILITVLALTLLLATAVSAGGKADVAYTWTIADLGQGVWGGGPLFSDGSTGGNLPLSFADGQIIAHFEPESWAEVDVDGTTFVDLCFNVRQIKGPAVFPPSFCLSDDGILLPITGTPIIIDNPEVPDLQLLIRVTPVN